MPLTTEASTATLSPRSSGLGIAVGRAEMTLQVLSSFLFALIACMLRGTVSTKKNCVLSMSLFFSFFYKSRGLNGENLKKK